MIRLQTNVHLGWWFLATRNIYIHIFVVFHEFYFLFIYLFFHLSFSFFFHLYIYLFLYLFYSVLHHTIKKLNLYHYNLIILLLYCYKKNSYLHIIVHYFSICFFQYYFFIMLLSCINVILQYSIAHSTSHCFVDCCRSNFIF